MASKVRLLEYLLIGAGTTSVLVILWLTRPWLLFVIIPVLAGVVVALWFYLPQSCVVEGRRALLKTPGRRIEVEFLEEPKLVEAGIWPKKRIFLGIGYRYHATRSLWRGILLLHAKLRQDLASSQGKSRQQREKAVALRLYT